MTLVGCHQESHRACPPGTSPSSCDGPAAVHHRQEHPVEVAFCLWRVEVCHHVR